MISLQEYTYDHKTAFGMILIQECLGTSSRKASKNIKNAFNGWSSDINIR